MRQGVSLRTSLIVAGVALGSILLFSILMVNFGFVALWNAFDSNLVAEVLGIVLVVFFVDRLLQRRERDR